MRLKSGRSLCLTSLVALVVGLAGRDAHVQGLANPASSGGDVPVGWASVEGGTTGGRGGSVVTVTDADSFVAALRSREPLIVRVSGTIRLAQPARVQSDKTLLGLGADAAIRGGGLSVRKVSNVIIRNLTIAEGNDAIDVDSSHHVWVDHCDLSDCQDGLLDIKHASDFVTVSWNHFHDHHKTSLVGHSDKPEVRALDTGHLRATYHHNFFDGTATRHPRVRYAEPVHVFNNYFLKNDHGVHSSMDAGVLVEGNSFEGVRHPIDTEFGDSPEPGRLVERDNVYVHCGDKPRPRGAVKEIGDAYPYTLDKAADVPAIVERGAGVGKIGE
jgi:pectate lyase